MERGKTNHSKRKFSECIKISNVLACVRSFGCPEKSFFWTCIPTLVDLVKVACRVKDSGSKRCALQPLMKCTPTFSPRHDKQMQCNAMIGGPGQAEGETFLKCDHGEDSKGEPVKCNLLQTAFPSLYSRIVSDRKVQVTIMILI